MRFKAFKDSKHTESQVRKEQPFPGVPVASQRKSSELVERLGVLGVWCLQSWDT